VIRKSIITMVRSGFLGGLAGMDKEPFIEFSLRELGLISTGHRTGFKR